MNKQETEQIQAAVRGRWLSVLGALAPQLGPALDRVGRHVRCPVHGGRHNDGFRVYRDVSETGGGICNTCGSYPNGFSLLGWANGWTYPETMDAIGEFFGIAREEYRRPIRSKARPVPAAVPARRPAGERNSRDRLSAIVRETVPITDRSAKPLWRYFKTRDLPVGRIVQAIPGHYRVLRFHPHLPYYTVENEVLVLVDKFPALVAIVHDAKGTPVTVHRTYLSTDGLGKADVPGGARKLYPVVEGGSLRGSAIRLGRRAVCMGLTEGIETALAVTLATGDRVWSVLNAPLLGRWSPPSGVASVVVWADRDRSNVGQEQAKRLAERLRREGFEVRMMLPAGPIPDGHSSMDWADVWSRHGAGGFRRNWWRRVFAATG